MHLSLTRIDEFLEHLETAKNDDELRRMFDIFPVEYGLDVPEDPFSPEYRQSQFALYEALAGRAYAPENEVTQFDVDAHAIKPFPFCHESSDLVGNQLLAIGYIIKVMALPPGAKILEFGPGWGNTTLILAKMGYVVTAVDIERNFVDLIKARASMENLKLEVLEGDFSYIETVNEKFDAVLFFECFHHAQDHLRLIAGFDRVLNPNGLVCFAAEPIERNFPLPWGLRMDGQSIWAIRKNGWLELGFNRKYFDVALARQGFVGTEHIGSDGPWSKALIARRSTEVRTVFSYESGALKHQIGRRTPRGLRITEEDHGFAAFGPYSRIGEGRWRAEIALDIRDNTSGSIFFDVVDSGGMNQILSSIELLLQPDNDTYFVDFCCTNELKLVEFRLLAQGGCRATIREIAINVQDLETCYS